MTGLLQLRIPAEHWSLVERWGLLSIDRNVDGSEVLLIG